MLYNLQLNLMDKKNLNTKQVQSISAQNVFN